MRAPSYCFKSLESIFYFRMRIPTDLQPIFNRTELKKSLRTKNESVALRRCRHYVTAAENVFESLRLKQFRAELAGDNANLQESLLPETSSTTGTARDKEKELWNSVINADKKTRQNTAQVPPLPETSPVIGLSELIQLYINEVTSQRGRTISQGIEKNLLRFLEIVTDKPLDQYGIDDRQRYRDVLQRMPKCVNRSKYQGMSILDIIDTDISLDELLSIKTVNKRLIEAATLFNWAVNNNLVGSHPFKNAILKIQQNNDAERPALSDEEIKKILENLPVDPDRPSLYFAPLISCFTALRQSEVAALDSDDISCQDGVWTLNINDHGDKRLKNKNARRIIPIHPFLLSSGLIELAKQRHGLKLFKDVTPYKGKYGHQLSKDFANYLISIGIHGASQTFHGIRHSVISKLWSGGILSNTLTLAQQFSATVFTYKGDDVVKTILQFAKEYRVGHIVIGTPGKVPFWRRLRGEASIAERLVTEGSGITLVVLDTKTISHEREIAELTHSNEGAFRGPEEGEIEGKASMRLSDAPVRIWDAPLENEAAVKFLVDACCQGKTALKEHAWEALAAREQQGETFGGDDVLISHARISGLVKPLVAIGIGKAGIHDSNVDRSVKIILLLLSPTQLSEKHLELLALLSKMTQSDQWRERVFAAKSPRDVRRAVGDWERLHLDE